MSWLSSASSFNPSLAWVLNNGGKGFIIVKFPFTLDSGWYHEQACTSFQSFQHRKERKGLKHEFIVLKLTDGSVCRIERMGDPNARLNALDPLGSVAHDIAQCFRPEDLDQAHLDSSELITEVKLPCEFDLLDVLKICRAIHEGEKTSKYTLQVYNCYFFSLAIQACLTRLVAGWENEEPLRLWLLRVHDAVKALTDIDQASIAPSSLFDHQKLFGLCFLLASHRGYNGESLMYKLRSRLQSRITTCSKDIQRGLAYRLNDVLWHSAIHSTLSEFIDEEVQDTMLNELRGWVSEATLDYSSNDPLGNLKAQSLSVVTELAVSAAGTRRRAESESFSTVSKCLKLKSVNLLYTNSSSRTFVRELKSNASTNIMMRPAMTVDQIRWITGYALYLGRLILLIQHTILSLWGITVFAPCANPIPCVLIDQHLDSRFKRLEKLNTIAQEDLEDFIQETRVLKRNKTAVWNQRPWESVCHLIKQHVSANMSHGFSPGVSEPKLQVYFREEQRSETVSSFQNHILERVKIHAKVVERFWLGSAANIQIELEDILSSVWKMIREDSSIGSTQKINSGGGLSSRKYVDLIFKASGKYGNWDPPHTVEVGDWGRVDRITGDFIKEGNIFRDYECSALLSDASDAPLFKKGDSEDVLRVTAGAQMEFKNDLYTEVGGMGELGVRVSSAWEFSPRNRAAVLTATDAYSTYLEVGVVFPRLRKLRKLDGKAIVTEALHCPAYALLLTEKGKGGKASLTLYTGLSETPASAGVGAKAGWKFTTESGFWRTACGYRATLDGNDAVYTPLYKLEKVSKGWRVGYRGGTAASSAPMEELVREDYNPPWDDLDEDGDEIPDSPMSPDF